MDVPPPAGAPSAQSTPSAPGAPSAPNDIDRRLGAIEQSLSDVKEQVAALAGSIQDAVRAAVADDVARVSADLTHTVSELGRLLVRDLGRLSKMLTEHQQATLDAVSGTSRWASTEGAAPSASTPPTPQDGATDIPVADGSNT